ncbi:hypothetical protein KP22_01590 [Pectobacterium betavasculorum]|uniref:Uncharacterized protein n=1 Tax=Pectobacterium betavasculorum TaxID=55207 RepID=A0A093RVF2_9GAMM|nr:hypothetical protein KP22_01590 [Pectobacterium betavasculorum]
MPRKCANVLHISIIRAKFPGITGTRQRLVSVDAAKLRIDAIVQFGIILILWHSKTQYQHYPNAFINITALAVRCVSDISAFTPFQ